MYTLFGGHFSRALIIEMVMAEGGIDYELREVDFPNDEHRSPEFLAINPAGWVPALITPGGETLYETPAIALHLCEQHKLTHLVPAVDDPDRGQFLSGFFYITDDIEPAMKRVFYPHRYVNRPEDTEAMTQMSLDVVLERLSVIEKRLDAAGPYHLGDRFSLVDLILTYWSSYPAAEGRLEPYPALRRCMKLVMERPALAPGFDETGELLEKYPRT